MFRLDLKSESALKKGDLHSLMPRTFQSAAVTTNEIKSCIKTTGKWCVVSQLQDPLIHFFLVTIDVKVRDRSEG